jgi:alkaline phosphatase
VARILSSSHPSATLARAIRTEDIMRVTPSRCLPALLLSATLCLGISQAQAVSVEKLVRFGLITDTHLCDKPDQAPTPTLNATARYFTGARGKIAAFADDMNKAGANFIAELGDFTDNPVTPGLSYEQRKSTATGFVRDAEQQLSRFNGQRYHVFGNHDTDQMSKEQYLEHIGNTAIPARASYYSFDRGGVHFIVLDASFKSDGNAYSGIPDTPGFGYKWSDANVPPAEIEWLKTDLANSTGPVIVFGHQYLNAAEEIDAQFDPVHSVRNAPALRKLLEQNGRVLAVFAGHYHDGNFQSVNGIAYFGLQASAAYGNDVAYHNQYALVDVLRDGPNYRIVVQGHGLQKSYVVDVPVR